MVATGGALYANTVRVAAVLVAEPKELVAVTV